MRPLICLFLVHVPQEYRVQPIKTYNQCFAMCPEMLPLLPSCSQSAFESYWKRTQSFVSTSNWLFVAVTGRSPYPGMKVNGDFYRMVKQGYHMGRPDFAPDYM